MPINTLTDKLDLWLVRHNNKLSERQSINFCDTQFQQNFYQWRHNKILKNFKSDTECLSTKSFRDLARLWWICFPTLDRNIMHELVMKYIHSVDMQISIRLSLINICKCRLDNTYTLFFYIHITFTLGFVGVLHGYCVGIQCAVCTGWVKHKHDTPQRRWKVPQATAQTINKCYRLLCKISKLISNRSIYSEEEHTVYSHLHIYTIYIQRLLSNYAEA